MEHLEICADVRFLIIKEVNCTVMLFQICAVVRILCLNREAAQLWLVMSKKLCIALFFMFKNKFVASSADARALEMFQ